MLERLRGLGWSACKQSSPNHLASKHARCRVYNQKPSGFILSGNSINMSYMLLHYYVSSKMKRILIGSTYINHAHELGL